MKSEKNVAKFAFGSVVTISDIKKGQRFSKSNIWVKRPGTGYFNAEKYNYLIGKTSKKFIKSGEQLKKTDVK